jgi:hypothetical protein
LTYVIQNSVPWPLSSGKLDFYVSRIEGITQSLQDNDYELMFRGMGFGLSDSKHSYRVSVIVNGKPISATCLIPTGNNHELLVRIPAEVVKPLFNDSKVVLLPVILKSDVMSASGTKQYQVAFNIVLLPRSAGVVEFVEKTEKTRLSAKVETNTLTSVTSQQSLGRKPPFEIKQEWKCAPNQRIVGVRYECPAGNLGNPGGIAGFTYNLRRLNGAGERDPDFDLLEDNTKVIVYRSATYHGTTTIHHHIDYRTFEKYYEASNAVKLPVSFHEQLVIELDPKNTQGEFTLIGKLWTGHKIEIDHTTINNPIGPLKLVGAGRSGDRMKLTFRLEKP